MHFQLFSLQELIDRALYKFMSFLDNDASWVHRPNPDDRINIKPED